MAIWIGLLGAALAAQVGAAPALPDYTVRRAPAPIAIDGRIGPGEWSAASPAMEFIFPWESQTGPKQKTAARLLWDDQCLYVAYECEDADITASILEKDAFVYRDDTVEIFLNVKPGQSSHYYCVEINVAGTIMDYVCVGAEYYLRRFDLTGLRSGISVDGTLNAREDRDRGWSLELAIPWNNFRDTAPPPRIGTIYTANLNRWDGLDPDRRLSVWADSGLDWPHPHAPGRFGKLLFAE
ncbi:MAG: carbohydrate-binding family 9-like protein [Candidatus Aminicenantales bacterium]